jgi:hypothetical protein
MERTRPRMAAPTVARAGSEGTTPSRGARPLHPRQQLGERAGQFRLAQGAAGDPALRGTSRARPTRHRSRWRRSRTAQRSSRALRRCPRPLFGPCSDDRAVPHPLTRHQFVQWRSELGKSPRVPYIYTCARGGGGACIPPPPRHVHDTTRHITTLILCVCPLTCAYAGRATHHTRRAASRRSRGDEAGPTAPTEPPSRQPSRNRASL